MNLGLTLEIVILSRHGSVAPYVTFSPLVSPLRLPLLLPSLHSSNTRDLYNANHGSIIRAREEPFDLCEPED